MIKFSIIIPVYNSEKHIKKAIHSLFKQTYSNFEIIVVNDGSVDNSLKILNALKKEDTRLKIYSQKNAGPGAARNAGIKKASGDYLLFLDSDDYFRQDALSIINENLEENLDILRFQITDVIDGVETLNSEKEFKTMKGDLAFPILTNFKYLDSPVCYCYNRSFFVKNKFEFIAKIFHEDFALIPLIILKANSIKCIEECLYYYVQTENSTMTNTNYNIILKKFDDAIVAYKFLVKELSKIEAKNKDVFESYISNAIIIKLNDLEKKDYKIFLKQLQELKVFDKILRNTLARKIKFYLLLISPRIYLRLRHKLETRRIYGI